jgi:hypothetical protein
MQAPPLQQSYLFYALWNVTQIYAKNKASFFRQGLKIFWYYPEIFLLLSKK